MYAVIQIGYAVYGIGSTITEAINNANEWMDGDVEISEFISNNSHAVGDIVVLRCSEALANAIAEKGGDIAYEITCKEAHLPSEE